MSDRDLLVEARADGPLNIGARRRVDRIVSIVLWLVVLANALAITVLWLQGGGVDRVHHLGDVLASAGRITGLAGAFLLLVQVLLVARLPFLERLAGFDRLTIWHRLNGKIALYLVLAHVVLITLGYMLLDRISLGAEIHALLTQYPGMVMATFGTALMIVTVVTSLVIVRQRLRYEMWYLVHFTGYAGIALGWPHQIPTGNEFVINHRNATYWTLLYVVSLALLVAFRLVRPAMQAFRYGLRVERVVPEGPGVVSLYLGGRTLDRLKARPGQFFLWRFLTRGHWWESHPFSLSAAPDGHVLRLTVKGLGDFSGAVGQIQPGTRVLAEGPFGAFTEEMRRLPRALYIAGGIGITPVRALIEVAGGDVVVIYRVMAEVDIIFREELDRLCAQRGIRLHYLVGDHRTAEGARLLTAGHLRALVPDIVTREVYLCGPPAMAEAILKNVRDAGVPSRSVHVERFAL